jgi:hypothetical protein
MYKIRGADGNEYGPITAEVLRQWIAQRRLVGTSMVQLEGTTEWKPLSSFPEFAADLPHAPAAPPLTGQPSSLAPQKTSGLAISSLVLGILGPFTCGLTALVGLILGIVSLVKIGSPTSQVRGKGLAIAGICVSGFFLLLIPFYAALLLPALAKAKSRASTISCVSNLKQIGLGARMWANDHGDTFPPDFLSMSNELVTPKVLVCPGDSSKTKVQDWSQASPNNITYEYLAPGIKEKGNEQLPVFRCPIHGNVCLGDGSVQQGAAGRKLR